MRIYVKPSGVELEVHDLSISAAEDLGWVEKKKRGRPKLEKPDTEQEQQDD